MTGATSALVVLFASCRRILGPSRDPMLNLANLGGRHPTKCPPAWKPIFLLCARPGSPISQSHPPGGLLHCHRLLSNLSQIICVRANMFQVNLLICQLLGS